MSGWLGVLVVALCVVAAVLLGRSSRQGLVAVPAVIDALARWAADELRSVNAQIELVLRRALSEAGRMPPSAAPLPRRGRPRQRDPAG